MELSLYGDTVTNDGEGDFEDEWDEEEVTNLLVLLLALCAREESRCQSLRKAKQTEKASTLGRRRSTLVFPSLAALRAFDCCAAHRTTECPP